MFGNKSTRETETHTLPWQLGLPELQSTRVQLRHVSYACHFRVFARVCSTHYTLQTTLKTQHTRTIHTYTHVYARNKSEGDAFKKLELRALALKQSKKKAARERRKIKLGGQKSPRSKSPVKHGSTGDKAIPGGTLQKATQSSTSTTSTPSPSQSPPASASALASKIPQPTPPSSPSSRAVSAEGSKIPSPRGQAESKGWLTRIMGRKKVVAKRNSLLKSSWKHIGV